MTNKVDNHLRAFGMSGLQITDNIATIEDKYRISLGHHKRQADEQDYYPQFDSEIRAEAASMASHYETFYCLEQSIRELIVSTLFDKFGSDWWNDGAVPANIVTDVEKRMQRDKDSGFSLRSEREIDYTNFGELSVIITFNWDVFGAIFSSKRAVERIMNSLNLLRGPIAHCSPLAADEVDRLSLTVKDWFRSMG
ncbi:MAG: hypothetical protein CMF74_11045 [Maricaulis sp.]|jgi:hypothetical protein|nr:hypothetical protein [Maricaulis sp.]HAQ34408.1 hypothetical protein [Alphaproteobacteria bacterium]|tara:strand:+ start:2378 stop:2962 length:585 start_codon:yes stop_codon:yes gene_type:complete